MDLFLKRDDVEATLLVKQKILVKKIYKFIFIKLSYEKFIRNLIKVGNFFS